MHTDISKSRYSHLSRKRVFKMVYLLVSVQLPLPGNRCLSLCQSGYSYHRFPSMHIHTNTHSANVYKSPHTHRKWVWGKSQSVSVSLYVWVSYHDCHTDKRPNLIASFFIIVDVRASFTPEMSGNNRKWLLCMKHKCTRETTGPLTTFQSVTLPRWKDRQRQGGVDTECGDS